MIKVVRASHCFPLYQSHASLGNAQLRFTYLVAALQHSFDIKAKSRGSRLHRNLAIIQTALWPIFASELQWLHADDLDAITRVRQQNGDGSRILGKAHLTFLNVAPNEPKKAWRGKPMLILHEAGRRHKKLISIWVREFRLTHRLKKPNRHNNIFAPQVVMTQAGRRQFRHSAMELRKHAW
jgi:hypothetical protein